MSERKIAKGIYWTPSGWRLYVWVGGRSVPRRIKDPYHQKGLVELRQLREDLKTDARRATRTPPATGSAGFAHDVRHKYLPAVAAMPSIAERTYHMDLWIREFGDRPSLEIQAYEVRQVRERWLTVGPKRVCRPWPPGQKPWGAATGQWIDQSIGLSPRQVNNRLRALQNFYTVVFGPHAHNPARDAGEAIEPEARAKAIAYPTIERILAAMPDRGRPVKGAKRPAVSLAKLRCAVIAYTGFSHGEVMAIGADDLHLEDDKPWVYVRGRLKGAGTDGTPQPLTPEGAAALRALVAAGGLGPFSRDAVRHAWQRACRALKLPKLTPYMLRHSHATELFDKTGGNLTMVQLLMRQRDSRTTLIYAKGAVDPVRQATLDAVTAKGGFQRQPAGKRTAPTRSVRR